jgi:hypothetical protein
LPKLPLKILPLKVRLSPLPIGPSGRKDRFYLSFDFSFVFSFAPRPFRV